MLNSIFKNSLEIPVIKLSGVIGQTGMFRSGINLFSLNKLIEKAFSGKKTKAVSLLIICLLLIVHYATSREI